VSTSKESALVACVTQEIYPELSARHVARVCVCVCARMCMCVRNHVYSTSGTREIETNDKNWSCVCVRVCVYVLYGATHATRTRIFQTRLSPNVKWAQESVGV